MLEFVVCYMVGLERELFTDLLARVGQNLDADQGFVVIIII